MTRRCDKCNSTCLYVYPRNGPAPGNMTMRCDKEAGHAGTHYCKLAQHGGMAWSDPPNARESTG